VQIKTEIIKGKELAEKFREAGKEAQDKIDKALLKAGLLTERTAKKYQTPHVDTGRLRASIATRLIPMNVEVGSNVEYARKHEEQYPFLKRALTDKEVEIKTILNKGLTDFMNDTFKGFTKIL